ncbi:MAG: SDR family oxidoreductase, partial [Acidobacteriaceae bacterium]|nr:SDR family oxidoreductase [Acidobacteriaceae bacterium]
VVDRNASKFNSEPLKTSLQRAIPLGGPGSVDQVAAAAAFLASDESDFITGTSMVIDGGYLCFARVE